MKTYQKVIAVLVGLLTPALVFGASISILTPSGGEKALRGSEGGAAYVEINTRNGDGGVLPPQAVALKNGDGGLALNQPRSWEYGSATCFTVDVNSAGADGGLLLAPDGGVPDPTVMYRCVNPSGSAGDLCYKSGEFLASCTARSQVRVVPGEEIITRLTQPIYAQSSSGAARLECCPISF